MSMSDPAFSGAGQTVGLELWRIENNSPVRIPRVNGKFHTGDSYILLATAQKAGSNALKWSIHYWLGLESTQDENGIVAYKTVELDDTLGGRAVQYREVQGFESNLFLSYFKSSGLEYLPGGVDSAFTHVERDVYETRLLHLKGKRTVRVRSVPVKTSSLNHGDVFILDMGLKIYLWYGNDANRFEKSKGVQTAQQIRSDERGGRAQVIIVNEDPDNAEFWGALGGKTRIASSTQGDVSNPPSLFRISDASGSLTFVECPRDAEGHITKSQLTSEDVFLLDVGSDVYVWVGRHASTQERRQAMPVAQRYVDQTHSRPFAARLVRVVEEGETAAFKGAFYQWDPPCAFRLPDYSNGGLAPASSGVAKTREDRDVDMVKMHHRHSLTSSRSSVGDGGSIQVWRVEDFNLVAWPLEKHGQFYGGDCFIVLYTYTRGDQEEYLLYYWLGRDSTADERGSAALRAVELDDMLRGKAVQVRVVQGKEPAHFRALFKGTMVVHTGGIASGFKNIHEGDSYDRDGVSLYHVKGGANHATAAMQVPEVASSLNSGDCFVLLTPSSMFVWVGRYSSKDEMTAAAGVAAELQDLAGVHRKLVSVSEGHEKAAFWEFLGGKGEYASTKVVDEPDREPRLFQMSDATGAFCVEEIENFAQEDLIDDDVMLLDTYSTVFVWVGTGANEHEKRLAMTTAQRYVDTAADGRDVDTPVVSVPPGSEPLIFTMHFLAWDAEMESKHMFLDPYEAKLARMREEKRVSIIAYEEEQAEEFAAKLEFVDSYEAAMDRARASTRGLQQEVEVEVVEPVENERSSITSYFSDFSFRNRRSSAFRSPDSLVVTYEDLRSGKKMDGVDPSRRHMYLGSGEFQSLFGCTKAEFAAKPVWKQAIARRRNNLY